MMLLDGAVTSAGMHAAGMQLHAKHVVHALQLLLDADLAGRSAMSKVTMDVDAGSASRSAGAYIQNLGSRSSDSNTWQMDPPCLHTITCTINNCRVTPQPIDSSSLSMVSLAEREEKQKPAACHTR